MPWRAASALAATRSASSPPGRREEAGPRPSDLRVRQPEIAWLDSYQLPRLVPPAYRMPWPNPWARALRDAERWRPDVVHAQSPFVTGLLARDLARARRGSARLHSPHSLRRLRPLPRPAGWTGIGIDRCLPAALLGALRGHRRALDRPRRRDPLTRGGGPSRPGARGADGHRRRRHPGVARRRLAGRGRVAERRRGHRHARAARAGEERRRRPRRRRRRVRTSRRRAPARDRRRALGGRPATTRGGIRRPGLPDGRSPTPRRTGPTAGAPTSSPSRRAPRPRGSCWPRHLRPGCRRSRSRDRAWRTRSATASTVASSPPSRSPRARPGSGRR